ncbi:MAG TPA: hypothetical protein VF490_00360 [Chryseosolibacter sp.]
MRRFSSLLFLFLILLNTFGSLQFLLIVERHLNRRAVTKIVENENEISGNLLLRVPLTLPYGADDNEYRSASGEIEVDGSLYHFVKQKMFRDTLYIVCLKDVATTEARKAISDYSRTFAGTDQEKPHTPKRVAESFLSAFCISYQSSCEPNSLGWSMNLNCKSIDNLYRYTAVTSVFHPPS